MQLYIVDNIAHPMLKVHMHLLISDPQCIVDVQIMLVFIIKFVYCLISNDIACVIRTYSV